MIISVMMCVVTGHPRCLETLHTSLASVSLPLLILHGDNDSLCQPAGSHLLARLATVHIQYT